MKAHMLDDHLKNVQDELASTQVPIEFRLTQKESRFLFMIETL